MKQRFRCDKCGTIITWDDALVSSIITENQCHNINLGKIGYGSKLDGKYINFCLCDSCLYELVSTLKLNGDSQ